MGVDDTEQVKLRSKKIGDVVLTVEYKKDACKAKAKLGVAVIYQRFTPRGAPSSEIVALPLVQPTPQVRINDASLQARVEHIDIASGKIRFHADLRGQPHARVIYVAIDRTPRRASHRR